MPKPLSKKNFFESIDLKDFSIVPTETNTKKQLYEAGITKQLNRIGINRIRTMLLNYLMGEKKLTLEQIGKLTRQQKLKYGREFSAAIKAHPVRGDHPEQVKRDNMGWWGDLIQQGLSAMHDHKPELPTEQEFGSEEGNKAYVTDTVEGMAVQFGHFNNMLMDQYMDPSVYQAQQRNEFIGSFGYYEGYRSYKGMAETMSGLFYTMVPSSIQKYSDQKRESMRSNTSEDLEAIRKNGYGSQGINGNSFLFKVEHIRDLEAPALEEAGKNLPALTGQKMTDVQKQFEDEKRIFDKDYKYVNERSGDRRSYKSRIRKFRELEEKNPVELAYEIYSIQSYDAKYVKNNGVAAMNVKALEEFLQEVYNDPDRSRRLYEAVVQRKLQTMCEIGKSVFENKEKIKAGSSGFSEFKMFAADDEMCQAIAEMNAYQQNADTLEAYDEIIRAIPKEARTRPQKQIMEDVLYDDNKEQQRAYYKAFSNIDLKKAQSFGFVKTGKYSIDITDRARETLEKRNAEKKLAEQRKKSESMAAAAGKVNQTDHSFLFDENLWINQPDQIGKGMSQEQMYSLDDAILEANAGIFDKIFGPMMEQDGFSLENFSTNGTNYRDTATKGLEDEVGVWIERRNNDARRRLNHRSNIKVRFNHSDEEKQERINLITKTLILQDLKKSDAGITYKNGEKEILSITPAKLSVQQQKVLADRENALKTKFDRDYDQITESLKQVQLYDLYKLEYTKKDLNLQAISFEEAKQAARVFDSVFSGLALHQQGYSEDFFNQFTVTRPKIEFGVVTDRMEEVSVRTIIDEFEKAREQNRAQQKGGLQVNASFDDLSKAFIIHAMVTGNPRIHFQPMTYELDENFAKQIKPAGKPLEVTALPGLVGREAAEAYLSEQERLRKEEQERIRQEEREQRERQMQEENDRNIREANERRELEKRQRDEQEQEERKLGNRIREDRAREIKEAALQNLTQLRADLTHAVIEQKKDYGPRVLGGKRIKIPSFTDRFKPEDFIEGFGSPDTAKRIKEILQKAGLVRPSSPDTLQGSMILYLLGKKQDEIRQTLLSEGKTEDELQNMDGADQILALSPEAKKKLGADFLADFQARPVMGTLAGSAQKTAENLAWYGEMANAGLQEIYRINHDSVLLFESTDELSTIDSIKQKKITKAGLVADMADFYQNETTHWRSFSNQVTELNPFGISMGQAFISKMRFNQKQEPDPTGKAQESLYVENFNKTQLLHAQGKAFQVAETNDPTNPNQNRLKAYKLACIKETVERCQENDPDKGAEYGAIPNAPATDEVMEALKEKSDKEFEEALKNGNAFDTETEIGQAVDKARSKMMEKDNVVFYMQYEKQQRDAMREVFENDHPMVYQLSINQPDKMAEDPDITKLSGQQLGECEKAFDEVFLPLRLNEAPFLRLLKREGAGHKFDEITAHFLIDGIPVMDIVTEKMPIPQDKRQDEKEWHKRHLAAKALIMRAMADETVKLEYRPAMVNPENREFQENLPVEVPHADRRAAEKRAQKKAEMLGRPQDQIFSKEPGNASIEEFLIEVAGKKVDTKAVQLYEKSLDRFNTKRLSIFGPESPLHERVREAAEALLRLRSAQEKPLGRRLLETPEGMQEDFLYDWMSSAQELLYESREYIAKKNPFTFAGADRYGGCRDLNKLASKEMELCRQAVDKLKVQHPDLSMKKLQKKCAEQKWNAAKQELKNNIQYEQADQGDKTQLGRLKNALFSAMAANLTQAILDMENGPDVSFYEIRQKLMADKPLSRALDAYLQPGSIQEGAVLEDIKYNMKGLRENLQQHGLAEDHIQKLVLPKNKQPQAGMQAPAN